MSESVEGMQSERSSGDKLDGELQGNGKSTKGSGEGSSVHRNANEGKGDVGNSTKIESTSKSDTSNSVETRKDHGNFGLVDGQVGGDRSVCTLLLEDLESLRIGGSDSRKGSEGS